MQNLEGLCKEKRCGRRACLGGGLCRRSGMMGMKRLAIQRQDAASLLSATSKTQAPSQVSLVPLPRPSPITLLLPPPSGAGSHYRQTCTCFKHQQGGGNKSLKVFLIFNICFSRHLREIRICVLLAILWLSLLKF